TGMDAGAPLTDEDGARVHGLTVEDLRTETLCSRVATVLRGTSGFCLRHLSLLLASGLLGFLLRLGLGLRLCAGHFDVGDLDTGVLLAVPLLASVTRLVLVLEDLHLVAGDLPHHLGCDLGLSS